MPFPHLELFHARHGALEREAVEAALRRAASERWSARRWSALAARLTARADARVLGASGRSLERATG